MRIVLALLFSSVAMGAAHAAASAAPVAPDLHPVLFNTAFESSSLGKIEKLSETEFRLHVKGQQDSRGRNRQATWFYSG